ncbi:MAG: 4Fe-4S dicluster domain-containing protein [Candidatus Bathyarchaeales archaeon]
MDGMKKKDKPGDFAASDIFSLLVETSEKEKRKQREELLAPLGVKEFFVDGKITIDKRTCKGVECKLCIKACPTNALFWKSSGEVGITEELCIYCGACVLNCIVDDCIKIVRRRENGEMERFSTPRTYTMLENAINTRKRHERVKAIFPTTEDYLKLYKPQMTLP